MSPAGYPSPATRSRQVTGTELLPAGPDDRVDGVPVRWTVTPASTTDVAEAMREADRLGLTVIARGRGTKMTWGRPPDRADLLVDLTRLNEVIEHEAGDLVVVAQAGLPLAELQQRLGVFGQRLALDEVVPGSTLGGIVSTGLSGPRRLLAGTVRDLLIGVTFVRADGVVAKAGGKVVKNVAGYDLCKLLTGSYGTLGIITEVAFRLHPVPAAAVWIETTLDSVSETSGRRLDNSLAALNNSQSAPSAIEIDWPVTDSPKVAVLVEGSSAGVDQRAAMVVEALAVYGCAPRVVTGEDESSRVAQPWTSGEVGIKLTAALSEVASITRIAHENGFSVRGSAGVGVLWGGLVPGELAPAGIAARIERVRSACAARGGSLIVVEAPAPIKSAIDVWGPINGLALMQRVAKEFDPSRRLAPGRFVGGL